MIKVRNTVRVIHPLRTKETAKTKVMGGNFSFLSIQQKNRVTNLEIGCPVTVFILGCFHCLLYHCLLHFSVSVNFLTSTETPSNWLLIMSLFL